MGKQSELTLNILPREFYAQNTVTVAKNLVGKRITRRVGKEILSGIITETEAYKHKEDPASHAFRKITDRNKIMFGEVGQAYVYFTYGMHYCFNITARHPKTKAGAVLIRALVPDKGIEKMQENRGNVSLKNLANGPAKLAQALQITKKQYGVDVTTESEIYISDEVLESKKIIASPRIGIREAQERLWNFKLKI